MANPYLLQATAAGQGLGPKGLNPAAMAALASAAVGSQTWAAAAQLQGPAPMVPLFNGGHTAAAQQVGPVMCGAYGLRSAILAFCSLGSQLQRRLDDCR